MLYFVSCSHSLLAQPESFVLRVELGVDDRGLWPRVALVTAWMRCRRRPPISHQGKYVNLLAKVNITSAYFKRMSGAGGGWRQGLGVAGCRDEPRRPGRGALQVRALRQARHPGGQAEQRGRALPEGRNERCIWCSGFQRVQGLVRIRGLQPWSFRLHHVWL